MISWNQHHKGSLRTQSRYRHVDIAVCNDGSYKQLSCPLGKGLRRSSGDSHFVEYYAAGKKRAALNTMTRNSTETY